MARKRFKIILLTSLFLILPISVWYGALYTPESVAKAFTEAYVSGDLKTMIRLSSGPVRDLLQMATSSNAKLDDVDIHIIGVRVNRLQTQPSLALVQGRATKRETAAGEPTLFEQELNLTIACEGLWWKVVDVREVFVRRL